MKNKEFHINGYRLQYWLYAILNKKFGKEVSFHRDSLHKLYAVNRHSFEISTNTLSIDVVKSFLISKLTTSNFQKDKNFSLGFVKETKRIFGKESLFVNLQTQKCGLAYSTHNKEVIVVNALAYWDCNKNLI